ncbi:MAG TPA: signal peptidase II [Chlamydiales bacterium]|nr:signal peptidase II [Chlamydiales bacterium]
MKKAYKPYIFFSIFPLIVLILDVFSKLYVHHHVLKMASYYPSYPYGGIAVFENFFGIDFSINHVVNKGAAWGVFSNYPKLLIVLRLTILVILGLFIWKGQLKKRFIYPLLIIIFGAVGNLIDIVLYSHVVDMFHFRFWGYSYPVFNIADSMIFIGMVWLVIASLTEKYHHKGK